MKNSIPLIVSSLCIVISFFIGFYFSERKTEILLQSYQDAPEYVNIKIKKNKLTVEQTNTELTVLINGNPLDGELTLENICK